MNLQDFLTTLVREKGVPAQAVEDLMPRLTKFITLNILTELATKNQALLMKFQSLTRGNATPETVRAFVEREIPDGAAFLAKVLTDFRQLYFHA